MSQALLFGILYEDTIQMNRLLSLSVTSAIISRQYRMFCSR